MISTTTTLCNKKFDLQSKFIFAVCLIVFVILTFAVVTIFFNDVELYHHNTSHPTATSTHRYPILSKITNKSIDPNQHNINHGNYPNYYHNYNYSNDPCIITTFKGLAKSGTHWLETTLKIIKSMTCKHYSKFDIKLESSLEQMSLIKSSRIPLFCLKGEIIKNFKHTPKSFDQRFARTHNIYSLTDPKRWCQVVTMRDPRNRILSYFMTMPGLTTNKSYTNLKNFVIEHFETQLNDTIEWWNEFVVNNGIYNESLLSQTNSNSFVVENIENGARTFVYFYEMYILSPKKVLSQMIDFLGIKNLWNENMIEQLVQTTNWDNIKDKGYNTHQSGFNFNTSTGDLIHQKQNICKYKLHMKPSLTNFCQKTMYNMMKQSAPLLLNLFNQTCNVFSHS